MQSIKRDLTIGFFLCALVFTCALTCGSPFVGAASEARAQDQQAQPRNGDQQPQSEQKSQVFTGTIVQDGSQYSLRDSSGQMYKLDDPVSAKHYVGKSVKVVGELDQQAMLIHVQSMEGMAEGSQGQPGA